ncbi:MAG: universal stress protein [Acidobacteriota bacterium]
MVRRILVPLDGSDYSKVATRVAIRIAKKNKSVVIGLGVVDTEEIEESAIGAGIGSSYYAEHLQNFKKNEALGKIKNFLDEFEDECNKGKVSYERYSKSGDPVDEIIEFGKTSDLIVTGLRTFFHFETTPEPGDTLKELLESGVCPIFAVPEKNFRNSGKVLFAYDNSVSAAKAMKKYVQLIKSNPFVKKVYVLNVNDDLDESNTILNNVEKYFKSHKLKVEKVRKVGKPREEIVKFARDNNIITVVMGAYGNNGLQKMFFGRTSKNIIDEGTIPVFVYH